jgi:hypothetical protein
MHRINTLKAILFLLVVTSNGFTPLDAQNTLYVKERSGAQTPIALSDIRRLDFTGGTLNLTQTDATTQSYILSDVRFLSFRNYFTGIPDPEGDPPGALRVYPNPVTGRLHVDCTGKPATGGIVEIIDLSGRALRRNYFPDSAGGIDVSDLKTGLYILRLLNNSKISGAKFIKN